MRPEQIDPDNPPLQPGGKRVRWGDRIAQKVAAQKAKHQPAGVTTAVRGVVAAPGMLDRKLTVVRQAGESDARYQARQELFDFLVETAKGG
jgi:hypothetical protein